MEKSRVFIIDDESVICDSCTQLLEREGYCVDSCLEGRNGLQKMHKFCPDVVLVDIRMPGMDGFAVLDKIRELDNGVITIVITGYSTVENAIAAMKKGAFDFLTKPLTSTKLKKAVENAIRQRKSLMCGIPSREKSSFCTTDRFPYVADIVAFVKPLDCPPSLSPFVTMSGWNYKKDAERQGCHFVIFRIRGTVDSYHSVILDNWMDVDDIDLQIQKELEIVRLSENAREVLQSLLERQRQGDFICYIDHEIDPVHFPYRH